MFFWSYHCWSCFSVLKYLFLMSINQVQKFCFSGGEGLQERSQFRGWASRGGCAQITLIRRWRAASKGVGVLEQFGTYKETMEMRKILIFISLSRTFMYDILSIFEMQICTFPIKCSKAKLVSPPLSFCLLRFFTKTQSL